MNPFTFLKCDDNRKNCVRRLTININQFFLLQSYLRFLESFPVIECHYAFQYFYSLRKIPDEKLIHMKLFMRIPKSGYLERI